MRNSQGLGFTIPSNTILREIGALIENGTYNKHPWLGVEVIDMTYEIATAMKVNITYGCLIVHVVSDGPADQAGLQGGTQQVQNRGKMGNYRRRYHNSHQSNKNHQHRRPCSLLGRVHSTGANNKHNNSKKQPNNDICR